MEKKMLNMLAAFSMVLASNTLLVADGDKPTQQGYVSWMWGLAKGGAGYVGSTFSSTYDMSARAVSATTGALSNQATNAIKFASSRVSSAGDAASVVGEWAFRQTINMLAEKYAAAGAGELAKDLLAGKSTTDVLVGVAVGAAMYFTLMKGYGAVSADMERDFAALTNSLAELKKAEGFKEKAPYVKLVITHLWVVIDDMLNMMVAIQKTLDQATELKLSGTEKPLVDPSYAKIMHNITGSYAAYLHAVLEVMGTVVPDMFEYFGSLEELSKVIKPNN